MQSARFFQTHHTVDRMHLVRLDETLVHLQARERRVVRVVNAFSA